MNISSVFNIVQMLIPAIKTAEEFIRGKGRGAEKKEAVLSSFIRAVNQAREEVKQYQGADLQNFSWVKFVLNTPLIMQKVGAVIDALVDLSNTIQDIQDQAEEIPAVPPTPPTVN